MKYYNRFHYFALCLMGFIIGMFTGYAWAVAAYARFIFK